MFELISSNNCMQVTWSQATSPVLERNITEVVPTSLRLNTVYIEVKKIYEINFTIIHRNTLQVYINWLYLIFLYLTPISILIIFNIRIYR